MLNEVKLKSIAELIRVDVEVLRGAIVAPDEVDIELPELTGYNAEELESLKKNIKQQVQADAFKTANEISIKDAKKRHGFEFEGKDIDTLIEYVKKDAVSKASMEPNKRIQEQENIIMGQKSKLSEYESKLSEIEKSHSEYVVSTEALNSVQKEYNLPKPDMLSLMKTYGYSVSKDEKGRIVTTKHGDTILDPKTYEPLSFDAVFDEFAKEKGQIKPDVPATVPAGRGGSSTTRPAVAFGTYKEFEAHWIAQGKSTNSAEFAAKAQEYSKNNPDFW